MIIFMKTLNLICTLIAFCVLAAPPCDANSDCGPVPPGMKQDKNCTILPSTPPSMENDLIAEGSIESILCERVKKKSVIYKAILKIDKVKAGPSVNKVDFLFESPKGPSVLEGEKGEFTLKRMKSDWNLVTKAVSVFSAGMLPKCK